MPEVSRFFGIVIAMYFKEHGPPHFHAKYAGQRAAFAISDLRMIEATFRGEPFRSCSSGRSSTEAN